VVLLSVWQVNSVDECDLTSLPSIFLAYPSESQVADSMTRLAEGLREAGAQVTTWQEITNPGFLFNPIRTAIEAASLVLAEATYGNANVLFELGYAIGRGKATLHLEDENAARPRRPPPLDAVRCIRYSQREDILDFLGKVDLTGPSLAEQMGLEFTSGRSGGLYFIPSRRGGDINQTIWRLCNGSPFTARTVDKNEIDYDSLTSQANSIAEADLFVTLLVSEVTKEYWDNNAEVALFAGLAAGLAKDFVVLVQQPLRRLLDLGDHAITFESESEAEFRLSQWLRGVAAARLRSPRPRTSIVAAAASPLTGLFLGNLDARADFDLSDYFIETPEFQQAESGRRHLFVGSKGSGKTANYESLCDRFEERSRVLVSVAPADFEFPRLTAVFDEHLALAHWEFVYGSFWRFILRTEILQAIRAKFLDHLLRESAGGKRYARELLLWFGQNEALLSLDFVSRVNEVLTLVASAGGDDPVKRAKLEEILQAARMYDIERYLKEFASQFGIRLLVDDLDRNWSPVNESANRLILALLNEILTLMTFHRPYVQPAIFLRKDVFDWLEENDPEFLKRDPAFLTWSREGLERLIATRIARHTRTGETTTAALWDLVFPQYTRQERTQDFIMSRTLLRPRDVIQFCQKAVEFAQRAGRLTVDEDDVYAAWEPSGELVLSQAEIEYQHRYPGLGQLALAFFEAPATQPWSQARRRLEQQAERFRPEAVWVEEAQTNPLRMVEVLYDTGIVGVQSAGGSDWFESIRRFRDVSGTLPEDFNIVVHPAFHRYLRCRGT